MCHLMHAGQIFRLFRWMDVQVICHRDIWGRSHTAGSALYGTSIYPPDDLMPNTHGQQFRVMKTISHFR